MTEPGVYPAEGPRRARVALLAGCANEALAPSITQATIRLLNRHGVEVWSRRTRGCCGSLEHHMGREAGRVRQGARQRRRLDPRDRRARGSTPS